MNELVNIGGLLGKTVGNVIIFQTMYHCKNFVYYIKVHYIEKIKKNYQVMFSHADILYL